MDLKIAVAGFRHGHINGLCAHANDDSDVKIVAACEEDPQTREQLSANGRVAITHQRIDQMLDEVDCDIVAVGDVYGKRGDIAIRALSVGKHVILDKPICTSLAELDQIGQLAADRDLCVGCMLDLRDSPPFLALYDLIHDDTIGAVQSIVFGGQHPLMRGARPAWYFEPGMHGGTINDIAIHAMDLIPWLTDSPFAVVNAARSWNAFVPDVPHFRDAGQMMLTLENGCGVLGDVSYFMPDSFGYSLPQYWRTTIYGERGILEAHASADGVWVAVDGAAEVREESLPAPNTGGYLRDFIDDICGRSKPGQRSTQVVLHASKAALLTQKAGDEDLRDVMINET